MYPYPLAIPEQLEPARLEKAGLQEAAFFVNLACAENAGLLDHASRQQIAQAARIHLNEITFPYQVTNKRTGKVKRFSNLELAKAVVAKSQHPENYDVTGPDCQ